jgi:hypothetical protein
MTDRMKQLMSEFARHIRSDNANTDEFLHEGMTFIECVELMDEVATAVEKYVRESK